MQSSTDTPINLDLTLSFSATNFSLTELIKFGNIIVKYDR